MEFIFSYWSLDIDSKYFRPVWGNTEEQKLKKNLRNCQAVEKRHKHFWYYLPETSYESSTSPHLCTWFQTDEAIIMVLSDNTFQVLTILQLL